MNDVILFNLISIFNHHVLFLKNPGKKNAKTTCSVSSSIKHSSCPFVGWVEPLSVLKSLMACIMVEF